MEPMAAAKGASTTSFSAEPEDTALVVVEVAVEVAEVLCVAVVVAATDVDDVAPLDVKSPAIDVVMITWLTYESNFVRA